MKPEIKKFLTMTAFGAVGTAVAMFACGFLADKLIAVWKFEDAGSFAMVIGTGLGLIGQLLALPAIAFSFGSDWPPLEIAGLILTFAFWGSLFALARVRYRRHDKQL